MTMMRFRFFRFLSTELIIVFVGVFEKRITAIETTHGSASRTQPSIAWAIPHTFLDRLVTFQAPNIRRRLACSKPVTNREADYYKLVHSS